MYVQDFTGDVDALLALAFKSPKLHPKKNPNLEIAMRVVGDTVVKTAVANIAEEIAIDLLDAVAMFEINNGEYGELGDEETATRSDYESGMDDVVEASFEDWEKHLSADWLGKNTIDTGLWNSTDEDRTLVTKLALSAAKEVFKQMNEGKAPAQILASAGVLKDLVQERLTQHSQGDSTMTTSVPDYEGVIAKMNAYLGKDFDQMAVYEDLETLIEDDDDILTGSAASRLGIDAGDTELLQIAAFDMGDAPSEILEATAAFKPAKGRKKPAAKKPAATNEVVEGAVNPVVLSHLKECGVGDTAMAETLGVSRSTYGKYVNGKTAFSPDADQYGAIREELIERTNKLLEALSALDGTELTQVA